MSKDTGSTHVLEAVIIASIMVSAVAFVVTFEQPAPATYEAREALSVKARDALNVLYDTPLEDNPFGTDALSAYVAECLNDRCDDLEGRLETLLPVGSSYALYLSNGYDTYPVIVKGEPTGEAVGATRTFEPDWSSTYLATATESIGTDDALLVYALPVFHSTPVSPGGSQLLIKLTGERADGSNYALLASGATVAQDTDDLDALAASLTFVDADGNALPVHDLSSAESWPQRVTLRLEESEGGEIPAGAEVTLHMPRGWTANAPQADNPDWTVLENADDKNGAYVGSAIVATLDEMLSGGSADLLIDLTYEGDVLDFYPFVATLSRGATGVANMLVRADTHDPEPSLATPLLGMSFPSPMGKSATTTWTLHAQIPVSDDDLPGDLSAIVNVHTIEIVEQDGNAIFGDVTATLAEAMGGTWTNGGDSLVWEGDVEMSYQTALNLTFHVQASGTAGPSEVRAAFIPPVTFDEWTGRLVGRTGWGFSRQAILPADATYAGYNTDTGVLAEEHPLTTDGVFRATSLPGSMTYTTSTLAAVQDSLYGSYVLAEDRSVPVGGNVVINADVQSLLFALAQAGQSAGVTLRFYPPWAGDDRVPVFEQENLDQGLLTGEVSQLVTLDLNADGFPDPIIGTTNGRVVAYHGLTGQRMQGNTFSVPLSEAAEQQQAVPRITAMQTIRLYGADYIVVGTDKNSDGIYVLDTGFNVRWSYAIGAGDTLAIDTSADLNADGVNEIVAARSYDVGTSKNALVYAFEASNDPDSTTLMPMEAAVAPVQDPFALYYSLGTPTTILGQEHVGPTGEGAGILVPIQTLFDPGITVDDSVVPPTVESGPSSTPRAGVQAIDSLGQATSTLFGAPASVLRTFDRNDDAIDDVVLGGASGYVIMANGEVLTQPLYSYIMTGATQFIGASTRSSSESYTLDSNGAIVWTDDAWTTRFAPNANAVGGKAIASNAYNSYWVVGETNTIWRSIDPLVPLPDDPDTLRSPSYQDIETVVPIMTRAGVPWVFGANIYTLTDIKWLDESTGYVVGSSCSLEAVCTEPFAMRTLNEGESWQVLTDLDGTLEAEDGGLIAGAFNEVELVTSEVGWMVGDDGLIVRSKDGGEHWDELPTGYDGALDTAADLMDIACKPSDPDSCIVIGEEGAAFETQNAQDELPVWTDVTGLYGLPTDRTLNSVAYADDDRAYIGTHNMVLARFWESNWTAMPLNYVENDGFVVSTAGDGTGWVYGGGPANGRIWFLHDYHTDSQAQTVSLTPELAGSHIYLVTLADGNVSLAGQTVVLEASTNGADENADWATMGSLMSSGGDPRMPIVSSALFDPLTAGSDLRVRITLETLGDKTLMTPSIRGLTFGVYYRDPVGDLEYAEVDVDFSTSDQADEARTSAAWDLSTDSLHQPIVPEFWTRNVSGQVHDIQTGFDVVGDDEDDVWVGTGDVIAENSPDYAIYAGTDLNEIMEHHDRVYLLDGQNGHPAAISEKLDGEVRQIRLVDQDGIDGPETLFAATWDTEDTATGHGTLYALDPVTLDVRWSVDLGRETPTDIEIGKLEGPDRAVFVGTVRPTGEAEAVGHLWAVSESEQDAVWRKIPDDMGQYYVTTLVKPEWLFGPYVVEIEVEWEDTASQTDASATITWPDGTPTPPGTPPGTTVLRSARFYDHFMVTPPDAVASPNPVYTARLLVWLRDWGG